MTAPDSITILSDAFAPGQPIPKKYTGEGEDRSPPLTWSGVPAGSKQLALICDDPDAPTPEPWVHWLIYGMAADTSSLPEGVPPEAVLASPAGARQGANSWTSEQTIGYRGPMPPTGHGVHHYHFKIYALDAELDLAPQMDKAALLESSGHILAEGELIGTYERRS